MSALEQKLAEPPAEPVVPPIYEFGAFRVEPACRLFRREGQPIALPPRIFDLLVYLIKTRHRVVEKDEILKAIWRDAYVTDDSLVQAVSALRRTLSDDAATPRYIQTISRKGYRFIGAVTEILPSVRPEATSAIVDVPSIGEPQLHTVSAAPGRHFDLRVPTVVFALLVVAGGVGWWLAKDSARTPDAILLTQPAPFGTTSVSGGVIAPDGLRMALVAQEDDSQQGRLWIRSLVSSEERVLDGTEGAWGQFWSPDSQSLGFFANGKLKTVSIDGGTPRPLASVGPAPSGGSWSLSGAILFADRRSGLMSVPAAGGPVTQVTSVDPVRGDTAHRWPVFLPDGHHYLYAAANQTGSWDTYVGEMGSDARTLLLRGIEGALFAPPDHLLYVRDFALFAHHFDPGALAVSDSPIQAANDVFPLAPTSGATISAAASGLLAYGGGAARETLAWVDRRGKRLAPANPGYDLRTPVVLDDRQFVAAGIGERRGIWLVDEARGTTTRLTTDGGSPIVSPDRVSLAYMSGNDGGFADIYLHPLRAGAEASPVVKGHEMKVTNDWTRDGRYIVYIVTTKEIREDIWLAPQFGDRTPRPYAQTPFNEIQAQVSPDNKWVAFSSDESGAWEVYIDSFPVPGARKIVSVGGGGQPQWRADGRELFYLSANRSVMAVPIRESGGTLSLGTPELLFRTAGGRPLNAGRNQFAVAPDGQRFLVNAVYGMPPQKPTTVIVNWPSRLLRRPN